MLALRVGATGLDGLGLTRSWGGGFYRRSRGCGPWRQADQEPSIGLALSEASGRRADGADAGAPGAGEGRGLPPPPPLPSLPRTCLRADQGHCLRGWPPGLRAWEGPREALLSAEKAAGFVL